MAQKAKQSVLYILRVLEDHSDKDHPLTQSRIRQYLKEEYGMELNRDTVKATLDAIQDVYGMNGVVKNEETTRFSSGSFNKDDQEQSYPHGWYFDKPISNEETAQLIDHLALSSSADQAWLYKIQKKLQRTMSPEYQMKYDDLQFPDLYTARKNPVTEETRITINKLQRICRFNRDNPYREKTVTFDYNVWDAEDGWLRLKTVSTRKNSIPLTIVEADHHYYLIDMDDLVKETRHFRIDLITHLEEEGEQEKRLYKEKKQILSIMSNETKLKQYLTEHPFMDHKRDGFNSFGRFMNRGFRFNPAMGPRPAMAWPYVPEEPYISMGWILLDDVTRITVRLTPEYDGITFFTDVFGWNIEILEEAEFTVTVAVECLPIAMVRIALMYPERVEVLAPHDVRKEVKRVLKLKYERAMKMYADDD